MLVFRFLLWTIGFSAAACIGMRSGGLRWTRQLPVPSTLFLRAGAQSQEQFGRTEHNVNEMGFNSVRPFESYTDNYQHSCDLQHLAAKYPSKVSLVTSSSYPNCDIILCGTVHICNSSVFLVEEAIQTILPDVVVIELCSKRIATLELTEAAEHLTMKTVIGTLIQDRDWRTFMQDLLVWLQSTAGRLAGQNVGGELAIAARRADQVGAMVVLGDRDVDVTMQRIFDRLSFWQRLELAVKLVWEGVTCTARGVAEFVTKHHTDENFVNAEVEELARESPAVGEVMINERDEYIAQIIHDTACMLPGSFSSAPTGDPPSGVTPGRGGGRRRRIVAVLGAAHLRGVRRILLAGGGGGGGGVSAERMLNISQSSRHAPTWPGPGTVPVVNTAALYRNHTRSAATSSAGTTTAPQAASMAPVAL